MVSGTRDNPPPTIVNSLIDCVKDCKGACEFNSVDFNSRKVKLYEVSKCMAANYESDFDPKEVCVPLIKTC